MNKEIDIDVKVTGLADLRRQLKESKDEILAINSSGIIDQGKLDAAVTRAGRLKDELNHTNEQIKIMSGGSDFEKVSNGLSLIGSQLKDMDFEGAAQSATTLTNVVKNMNPKEVMAGFKSFITVIGQLGTAFLEMGLKLLANPIFLLIAVVGAIVAVIVIFKDKIKILGDAFDMMMMPLNLLIQGLKNLGDWLGLTTFAEDEAADKTIAAAEKRIEANKKVTENMDREFARQIKLAKANGEDVLQLQLRQAAMLQAQAGKDLDEYNSKIANLNTKFRNETDKKEKEEIKKKIKETQDLRDEAKQKETDVIYERKTLIAQHNTDMAEENKKANEKALKDRQEHNKKIEAAEKEHLALMRSIEDLEIANMEDGLDKDIKSAQTAYDRKLEDMKKFHFRSEDERDRYEDAIRKEKEKADKEAIDKDLERIEKERKLRLDEYDKAKAEYNKFREEVAQAQQKYDDFILQKTGTELQKRQSQLDKDYKVQQDSLDSAKKAELELVKGNWEKEIEVQTKYQELSEALEKLHNKESGDIKDNADKEELKKVVDKWVKISQDVMKFANQINALLDQNDQQRIKNIDESNRVQDDQLERKHQTEVSREGLSAAQKKSIDDKYAKLKYQNDLKAWKETENIKKQQFARDKAFRMAGVVMDTAAAIAKSVSESPETFGAPWSIFSAANGAIQLAAIASQTYQGSAGPSAPSIGGVGGTMGSANALTPLMNNTNKNNFNNVSDGGNTNKTMEQSITVHAIVSETEMTHTQGRVARMQKSAEL